MEIPCFDSLSTPLDQIWINEAGCIFGIPVSPVIPLNMEIKYSPGCNCYYEEPAGIFKNSLARFYKFRMEGGIIPDSLNFIREFKYR